MGNDISDQSPQAIPYDFRKPYKSELKRDSAVGPLHVPLAACLTEHLGTQVEICEGVWEQMRYEEFLASVASPGCLSVLRVDPPGVQACLDVGPGVVFPMIDRLLGGTSGAGHALPRRAMTQIERGLALGIIERVAGVMADTWSGNERVDVREEEMVSESAEARIMPGDEVVHVVRFEVGLEGSRGVVRLCLPAPVVEMLEGGFAKAQATENAGENLTRNILNAAVELRALLAETKLRLDDVVSMQVGDVITTETPADAPVPVKFEERTLFAGELGQLRGTRAITVTSAENLRGVEGSGEKS